jgi:hypothetical protein
MALARVVSFEAVNADRMAEMSREMQEGERPEGLPATEVIVLHDPDTEKSLATRHRLLRRRGRLQAGRRNTERHACR